MPTMRTLPKAVMEITEKDPSSSITLSALRRWVKEGKVASVKVGKNYLCNMESVEAFLSGESGGEVR